MIRWLIIAAALLGGFVLVVLYPLARAGAHEWYPPWCCSGGDCGPLAASRVQLTAAGYVVDGRFTIPLSEARKSMDGRYHGCFPTKDDLKCFFAPPPGS